MKTWLPRNMFSLLSFACLAWVVLLHRLRPVPQTTRPLVLVLRLSARRLAARQTVC